MSYPTYYVEAGDTLPHLFDTFDGGTGASITMTGLAVTDIEIYKDGSVTQRSSDAGYTLLDTDGIDFDGLTGIHGFSIDLSDDTDAGFYAVGSWYHVVVSAITVDAQTVSFVACAFRIVSATRGMAGTALPNAAADAAGGLPISDAGGLDLDAQIGTDIDAILADTGTDGVLISGTISTLDALMLSTGTAQAGGDGTITLAAGESAVDDYYTGAWLFIISGTGAGQARLIKNYVGSSKVTETIPNWGANPSSDSVYAIFPTAGIAVRAMDGGTTLQDLSNGDVSTWSTYLFDGYPVNSLTAAALADFFNTDSLTDYASAVAGSVVKETADNAGGSALTVADIADGVWDEDATGHQTAGTFGQAIGDPGANTETMYDAVVTDAAGTNVAADVIAVKADTAATLTDTAEIGAAGAGLTEAGGTGDQLTAVPWNAAWDAEVQSEVADALAVYDPPTNAELVAEIDAVQVDIAALNDPTAAVIADAVWDETQAGHTTAGTFGELATEIAAILVDTGTTLDDKIDAIDTVVDAILVDTGTDIPALINALNDLSAADVNAQVLDVLNTDTFAEPASVPAATASLVAKIGWLYILSRNKLTQTASTQTLRNDADSGSVGTASVSDDGTTATRAEWS